MRSLIIAAGLISCLGLAACQQSQSDAQTAAPAPKRDLGRSQVFYQGQGLIEKINTATVEPGKGEGALKVNVSGVAPGGGYKDVQLVPRIYPAAPPDGVYEIDVVATKPANATATPTPVDLKMDWVPQRHMKAVRFMSATNDVEVALPTEVAKK